MDNSEKYMRQVELLLDVLPFLNELECFALKGGTAINMFFQDMPRLSVDIDLSYLPIEPRAEFLKNITRAILELEHLLLGHQLEVQRVYTKARQLSKLIVHSGDINIKVEPNLVLRGSVFNCETRALCSRAQEQFLRNTYTKILSLADTYAGKICAVLSRQHPRDLFDIKYLLENQGLTDEIRQAFIIYLCSANKPMYEMLQPKVNRAELEENLINNFSGMTQENITCDELIDVKGILLDKIFNEFTKNEKEFILSVKSGEPDWKLLPLAGIEHLPGIQWKVTNIRKMESSKRQMAFKKLQAILSA